MPTTCISPDQSSSWLLFNVFTDVWSHVYPVVFPRESGPACQRATFPAVVCIGICCAGSAVLLLLQKKRGAGQGIFNARWFTILFAALLFIQLILPLILGLRQTEAWVTSQISLSSYALWLSTLTLIFIAPVYEEIVFRGCLFNAFQYWFNNKTAVVSGGIGHFCHHAYAVCGFTYVADVVSCVAGFDHRQTEKQRPVDADHAAYSDERDGYCSANGSPDVTT